jgi:hypothetical protein
MASKLLINELLSAIRGLSFTGEMHTFASGEGPEVNQRDADLLETIRTKLVQVAKHQKQEELALVTDYETRIKMLLNQWMEQTLPTQQVGESLYAITQALADHAQYFADKADYWTAKTLAVTFDKTESVTDYFMKSTLGNGAEIQYVLLLTKPKHDQNDGYGFPFVSTGMIGHTQSIRTAALFTAKEVDVLSNADSYKVPYALEDPELRKYLYGEHWSRGSEFDLWLENRRLQRAVSLLPIATSNDKHEFSSEATVERAAQSFARLRFSVHTNHAELTPTHPEYLYYTECFNSFLMGTYWMRKRIVTPLMP